MPLASSNGEGRASRVLNKFPEMKGEEKPRSLEVLCRASDGRYYSALKYSNLFRDLPVHTVAYYL